jgi:hypothetical protein
VQGVFKWAGNPKKIEAQLLPSFSSGLQLHNFTASQLHSFTALQLHSFTAS